MLKKNSKKIKDIKGVVTRQKRYSTLAKKEGDYASKKATEEKRKGLMEMYKDSKHEAKLGYSFAKKRKLIAKEEEKKLNQYKFKNRKR